MGLNLKKYIFVIKPRKKGGLYFYKGSSIQIETISPNGVSYILCIL